MLINVCSVFTRSGKLANDNQLTITTLDELQIIMMLKGFPFLTQYVQKPNNIYF